MGGKAAEIMMALLPSDRLGGPLPHEQCGHVVDHGYFAAFFATFIVCSAAALAIANSGVRRYRAREGSGGER
jgi:hypothetical protein